MSTKISWADESWNPIVGCSKISAGCVNCYAEKMAFRLFCMEASRNCFRDEQIETYSKVIYANRGWNGKTHFVESALTKPLHWRKPRKIFVCSMSDLFHESVPFEWIDRVFAVMALCPQHEFKVLTKRAGRMREYFTAEIEGLDARTRVAKILGGKARLSTKPDIAKHYYAWFNMDLFSLPNVHLGVTVENQDNVGRIADLVRTPATKRFVSFEPLLGRIDLNQLWGGEFYCPQCRKFFDTEKFWMCPSCGGHINGQDGDGCETTCPACKQTFGSDEEVPVCPNCDNCGGGGYIQPDYSSCFSGDLEYAIIENIDNAFIGCESGPGARLCSLDDIRYLMQQCRDAGVKIHVKQIPLNGKCNKNFNEWPEEFRVREV